MPALIGPIGTVVNMNQAVLGNALGNPAYASQLLVAESVGGQAQIIANYNSQLASSPAAALATTVMNNLFITVAAGVPAANVTALTAALTQAFQTYPTAKGQVINNLSTLLGTLETDPNWGPAARAFNAQAAADYTYSINPANTSAGTPSATTTFTLTTNIETINASGNNVNGVINGAAAANTFQTGDTINNAGNLNVTVAARDAAGVAATINTAANVNFSLLVDNQTVDATLWTAVANMLSTSSAAATTMTVNNGALVTSYGVGGSTNAGGLTVGIRASDLTGSANTLNLKATGAGSVISSVGVADVVNTQTIAMNSAGVESVALTTSGTNVLTLTDAPAAGVATDYASMTVTGSGNNTINVAALTQNLTYNMSTATGNNTLRFDGALQSNTSITGGSGTDTIRVAQNTVTAGITATGVEILRSANANASGTIAFNAGSSLTTLRVDGDTAEDGTLTLINPGSLATVNYIGDGLSANVNAQQQFIGSAITGAYTGTADTVTMNFTNKGVNQLSGFLVQNGYTANGVEAFVINSSTNTNAGATTTIEGLASNTLQTVSVTTAGAINTGVINAAPTAGNSALTSVNLSGVTGTAASTVSFDGVESVGAATQVVGPAGTGNFTLVTGVQGAADTLLVTGGNSTTTTIDAQTAAAGRAAFAGTLVYTSSVTGVTNTLNVGDLDNAALTTSTTIATFSGIGATNAITGGVGADSITITANANGQTNRVTGGDQADAINVTGVTGTIDITQGLSNSVARSAATLAGSTVAAGDSLTFGNGVDVITGFTAGAGGDTLNINVAAALPTTLIGETATDLTAAANEAFFASGTYVAGTGVFTISAAGVGPDTMIVQAASGTAASDSLATNASIVILVGVDSDNLVAANFT